MELGVAGKVYMICAASQGLGYGVAAELSANGANVSICSRRPEAIADAAKSIAAASGNEVMPAAVDVTKPDEIAGWRDRVVAKWGRIDGLLINAGGPPPGSFDDLDDAAWEAAFQLTLMSAVRLVRATLPSMRSGGGGSILAVASSSVKEPIDRLLLSNVLRSGVANLMKSLSRELAAESIRVNTILPGRIDTPRLEQLDESSARNRGITVDEARRESESKIPFGRYGTVAEFGRVGAFLLSPAASYVTGDIVTVDGGTIRGVW